MWGTVCMTLGEACLLHQSCRLVTSIAPVAQIVNLVHEPYGSDALILEVSRCSARNSLSACLIWQSVKQTGLSGTPARSRQTWLQCAASHCSLKPGCGPQPYRFQHTQRPWPQATSAAPPHLTAASQQLQTAAHVQVSADSVLGT